MGQIGNATVISYCTTEGGSYSDLARVTDSNLPEISVAKVDSTAYDSPDETMEYVSGVWQDPGDADLEIEYDKAQTTTLYAQVGVQQFWKITLKDGSVFAFPGFLSKLGMAIPNKDVVKQKVTIAATGVLTYTAGS